MRSPLARRIEVGVCAFTYGGLLLAAVGVALQRGGADWGMGLCIVGGLLASAGAVLVFVRSRIKDEAPAMPSDDKGT